MSVTFKQVAELAGVSTQTVSRVTNGASNVAQDTRDKVNAAIAQLGYVPNKGAQLLSGAKSKVIGLITLDVSLHGISLIANNIRIQAQRHDFGTAFSVVDEHAFDKIVSATRELTSQRIEYIIVNLPLTKNEAEQLVELFPNLHFVFIDVPDDSQVNSVSAAHYQGASDAASLMLKQQRHRLLLLTGPSDSSASKLRLQGWLAQIERQKATVVAQLEGDWLASSGYQLTREALRNGAQIDGVLVASDQMALGVLRALHEHALTVPQQVAVIGFDDSADSAYFSPPLTTIKQDFSLISERAIAMLFDDKSSSLPLKASIATQLIERQSTQLFTEQSYNKAALERLLLQIKNALP
ncbi:LacI family DNA-binding transcriptional regulator [Agarivorans sp. TSD2052]|uniref:LacI family DNA-binding transcriptional regulator n=1 Tax=Agarivorans sp. TSD2052 TaxID=2937286 RepID=UPI00200CD9C9|nr:LacI family DNA-binding transcriptional regulator [Agarivorans sp. TSD2052]UPW19448.1 LacI family DNA-binding transcriptional regulator [Agarivorans sp. TSD2052]